MKGLTLALVCLAGSALAQNEPISISGTVLDSNGIPLRKANVVLQPVNGARPANVAPAQPYAATSDGSGRFALTNVEPGRYMLSADHIGYLRTNYGSKGSAMILSLLPDQEMTDISIRMTEQSVITGKVVDEDGDPVSRVQVRLLRKVYTNGQRQLGLVGSAQVDDIGEFRISGVAAGQYYLIADPQRGPVVTNRNASKEQPVVTYYPGVTDAASAVPLKVTAGETLVAINIRLARAMAVHVRGTVTGLAANPGLSRVSMTPRGGGMSAGAAANNSTIDKDGHFDVGGVAPGSWNISVFRAQGPVQLVGTRAIEVSGQDIDDLVLNASPPAEIHGVVRFEGAGDTGQANLRIALNAVDGLAPNLPNAQVDAEGNFTLPGAGAGRYRLSVAGIPQGSYLKAVKVDGRDELGSGFEVGEGGGVGSIEVAIGSPGAEVFGIVLGVDGNNAPGSVVTLVPDPFNGELVHLFQRITTDQNGRFSFRGMAPGSYRVYAWDELEPGAQFDPDLIRAHDDMGVSVTVSEGDRTLVTLTEVVQ